MEAQDNRFLDPLVIDYGVDEAALKRVSDFLLLAVTDGSDKVNYKKIKEARKELRDLKKHVKAKQAAYKEQSRSFSKTVDQIADAILEKLQATDSHLITQENIVKDELQRLKDLRAEEAKKKIAQVDERIVKLAEYGLHVRMQFERDFVQNQTDSEFENLLEKTKKEYEESIAVVNKVSEATETVTEAVGHLGDTMRRDGEAIANSEKRWGTDSIIMNDLGGEGFIEEGTIPDPDSTKTYEKDEEGNIKEVKEDVDPITSEEPKQEPLIKYFGFFKTDKATISGDVGDFYFVVKKENAELVSKLLTQNING